MKEFKITNSYVTDQNGETAVVLCGRDSNNELHKVFVGGVEPHFHVPTTLAKEKEDVLIRQNEVIEIDHEPERQGWKGTSLSKVILGQECDHWDVRDVSEANFSSTELFQSDVFLNNQLRIENDIYSGVKVPDTEVHQDDVEPVEIEEFRTRICYFDIEVDDRGEFVKDGSRPIISIVAMDSYTEEVVGFFWKGDDRRIETCFPNGRPEKLDRLEWTSSESEMLKKFTEYIRENDPDMLTGWNFTDFDAPYLLNRFDELNLDKRKLSRSGYAKISNNNKALIGGRAIYDLKDAWERTKYKEPDSTALDNVAKKELGEAKLEHPGLGYQEMWEKDPELLMNYNAQDVILCHKLNEELGTLSFWRTIGDTVGVDWENTTANSDYIRMFCLRKLYEKNLVGGIRDYGREEDDYEGAYVFDPYYGRARNVMGLDLASLYPNSMAMGNLSPEKKILDEDEIERLKAKDVPVCVPPIEDRTVAFRLDEDGIFKELVDDAIGLKKEAKRKRNAATPGTEEHEKLSENYDAKKTVTNSVYGVLGWEPFFLYDDDCAEATTLLGQAVIRKTAKFVEERDDAEVVYGDTDSNYIKFDESLSPQEVLEIGEEICKTLNEEIYPSFAEEFGIPGEMNRWDIEPEVIMDTFFQIGKKKFYAYKIIWEDGHWLDEPDYTHKGFGYKKSSSAELTQETGYKVVNAILDWKDEDVISDLIYEATKEIDRTDPEWDRIGIPQGLGKEIHENCECEQCYNWSKTGYHPADAHPRAAYFTNCLTGRAELDEGSKPKRVYLEPTITVNEGERMAKVDVIGYENFEDLPEQVRTKLRVDVLVMTEKLIKNPFDEIVEAVGVDIDAAVKGQQQAGFGAFM